MCGRAVWDKEGVFESEAKGEWVNVDVTRVFIMVGGWFWEKVKVVVLPQSSCLLAAFA
jgi:hypothetical protein